MRAQPEPEAAEKVRKSAKQWQKASKSVRKRQKASKYGKKTAKRLAAENAEGTENSIIFNRGFRRLGGFLVGGKWLTILKFMGRRSTVVGE